MKIAIMQPYFLPYIVYFQLINAVDKFVIYDDVDFITRGYIHRNYILSNSKKLLFSLAVTNKSQNRKINEHYYSFNQKWMRKFLKTLKMSYSKAPFFMDVFSLIEEIFIFEEMNVGKYNYNSIKVVSDYLKIRTKIISSSSVYKNENLKGQRRILDICKKEDATHYINPIGGKDLYSKDEFSRNGIGLFFLKPLIIEYKQFNNDFVPWLSIIDIMMFNGKDRIKKMLNNYALI